MGETGVDLQHLLPSTIEPVRSELDDVLHRLRESADAAKDLRIELTDEYLQMIAQVESRPENQSGADKGSRWIGGRPDAEAALRNVRPVSRRT